MNPALRSSSSIELFRLNLEEQNVQTTPFFPHLYSFFSGKAAVYHTHGYGMTTIRNIFTLTVRGSTLVVRI